MKKILAITLCLLMVVFCFASCGAEKKSDDTAADTNAVTDSAAVSDLAQIIENGKLVIGITEYEPMNYMEDGEWTGFDTEFALAVCEQLGVTAEFREIEWDNRWIELDAGTIDCVWNGMTLSDETAANANCTDAYVVNAQVVVTDLEKNADIKTVDDLKDMTFAVESGSAGAEAGTDNGLTVVEYAAQSDALMAVESGKADACIIDITMANAMTGEGTSYAKLGTALSLTTEEYGIACRKDSDLTAKLNELMDTLTEDGTLPALAEKYELTLCD